MAVGEKTSPLHIWSKKGGWFGSKKRKAERERTDTARADMDKSINEFENLDTSNLFANAQNAFAGAKNQVANVRNQFANLENTAEDLTVNTQAADFEREQFQQSQANLLQNLQGAAGGSGVAGLAQALANQGAQQARQSSASIGQQESANQAMAAQQAGAQQMVLGGAAAARDLEYQKQQGIIAARTGQFESAAEEQRYNSTGAQFGRFVKGAGELVNNVTPG